MTYVVDHHESNVHLLLEMSGIEMEKQKEASHSDLMYLGNGIDVIAVLRGGW